MIRTIASIFITLALLISASLFELRYVNKTFTELETVLEKLQKKTELGTATYEDGNSVRVYWDERKDKLHIWLPHTALQEMDYQLNEAVGFIYVRDFKGALPKIEVLRGLAKTIPHSYKLELENIF